MADVPFFEGAWAVALKDQLLFTKNEPAEENQVPQRTLWTTDGTVEGTRKLSSDDRELPSGYGERLSLIQATEAQAFYFENGELWATDGTESGTVMVQDKIDRPYRLVSSQSTAVGDTIFFRGSSKRAGGFGNDEELWRSDGTTEGTIRYDINPTDSSGPKYLTEHNGYVYFSANDGFYGAELWRIPIELPAPEPFPGDTNADGTVDFTDFLALSANFGRDDADGFSDGDFNDDYVVDFADFLVLSENFGRRE